MRCGFEKGPRNHWFAQGFGKVRNGDFPLNSDLLLKIEDSIENAKMLFCNFRIFLRFLAPRGPDAPDLVKLMVFHMILGVSGALGPIFRKSQLFTYKS